MHERNGHQADRRTPHEDGIGAPMHASRGKNQTRSVLLFRSKWHMQWSSATCLNTVKTFACDSHANLSPEAVLRLVFHSLHRVLLTNSVCVCVCVWVECWRAISPFFDGSRTSSTTASAGSSAEYQSGLSGCSRSRCVLFPLNLAAWSCAVVGRICYASGRLAVPDPASDGRRREGRHPSPCNLSNTSTLFAKYARRPAAFTVVYGDVDVMWWKVSVAELLLNLWRRCIFVCRC